MAIEPSSLIWQDGTLIPWNQANTHVLTATLHYGVGAFEGIRCYRQKNGSSAIFRLRDHILRLFRSCKILQITIPYTPEQLEVACLTLLKQNQLAEAYIRPLVYLGGEFMGIGATGMTVHVCIIAYAWQDYLKKSAATEGIRAKISSFPRANLGTFLAKGKICGQYVSADLARREVKSQGYEEAILLDSMGHIAEGSGDNIFVVRDGHLLTPPLSAEILAGLTRDSVIHLAKDMGLWVEEALFARDELYLADEAFVTGTAAEVIPVREVDDRAIGTGQPGPITQKIQAAYHALVRGENDHYPKWLSPV